MLEKKNLRVGNELLKYLVQGSQMAKLGQNCSEIYGLDCRLAIESRVRLG